ncbi:MAG: hypothetical protein HUU21_25830 [Polyangiaceae bacterium]|nr:hypothetical protein [Polyangiaceae bacterium]NUQ76969.1 hypothetical protein [Polyangiaceae bacterium]
MENPRRTSIPTLAALAVASLAALSGCGSYISDYVPPDDGRARAVWRDGNVEMEGADLSGACAAEIGYETNEPPPPYTGGSTVRVHGGFWVPVYFGPRIVVVHRGVAPRPHYHATRVRSVSSGGSGIGSISGGGGGGGKVSSGGSSGGGGSSGDIGKGAVILAVVALIALPAIALGLSLGRTEAEKETALTIDRVNAYNDLARTPGSPCAIGPWVAVP